MIQEKEGYKPIDVRIIYFIEEDIVTLSEPNVESTQGDIFNDDY